MTIDPKLNDEKLGQFVEEARKIIIKLYINCEKDFQKGLSIFEAIVKKKMLDTAQQKITNLTKQADQLLQHTPEVTVMKADVKGPVTPANMMEPMPNLVQRQHQIV